MADSDPGGSTPEKKSQKARREIPGNFTYTTSFGALKRALEGIIVAERPAKFSGDFLGTVLKISGGSARPLPPILKRMGFLSSDGTPTDLYLRFKSDAGRSAAALEGLKRSFAEIFKHNEYAHKASRNEIVDLLVRITGLNKNDQIINAISGTFESIRSFVDKDQPLNSQQDSNGDHQSAHEEEVVFATNNHSENVHHKLGLAYNINIILPETTDIQVFNAIFQSLKRNIL